MGEEGGRRRGWRGREEGTREGEGFGGETVLYISTFGILCHLRLQFSLFPCRNLRFMLVLCEAIRIVDVLICFGF